MILKDSSLSNEINYLKTEEIEKYFPLPLGGVEKIFKIHKEISTRFTTKVPSIIGYSQEGIYFSDYIICYVINVKINIEYISNSSLKNLMLLPINFYYTSYIPLKDKYETPRLNPKINDSIIEILDEASLYVYINFSPY